MELLTTREFNGAVLDCYVESGKESKRTGDFWATREQIGRLLEYSDPDASIRNIHSRNKERLDKFSTCINLIRVEGMRTVTREVIVYNFKGLLEICRYSNQPRANAVMDFLWEIADEIRRTGSYNAQNAADPSALRLRAAEVLKDTVQYLSTPEEKQIFTREIYKFTTGSEMPEPPAVKYYTADEIARSLSWSSRGVMRRAKSLGITDNPANGYWSAGTWYFSEKGREILLSNIKIKEAAVSKVYWTAQQIGETLKWPSDAVMYRAENLELMKKSSNGYWDGDTWYFSKEGRKKFFELVNRGIVKIEDGYEYYENGGKMIHWSFNADAARI